MKLGDLDPSIQERLSRRPGFNSSVTIRCRLLLEKSLDQLTAGDVAFCLRQTIAIPHVVPIALDLLDVNPIVEAELYDGDLLVSLLLAAEKHALTDLETTRLWDACAGAAAATKTLAETVIPKVDSFFAREQRT